MKKEIILMNKMFFLLMMLLPLVLLCAEDFYFDSTTDGKTVEEVWNINFTNEGFSLYAGGQDKQVEMEASSDSSGKGIKTSYSVPAENNRFIAARQEGNRLILSGVDKNRKQINKSVKLSAQWFSNFYIMPQFILSDTQQIDFCILEPLNSSVIKMRAIKEAEPMIEVDGNYVETIKVRLTLPGIAGAFWHSYIWYRKSDGIFIKTDETRGFPGTPRTYMMIKHL
jgi:hypothetical protein